MVRQQQTEKAEWLDGQRKGLLVQLNEAIAEWERQSTEIARLSELVRRFEQESDAAGIDGQR